MKRDWRTTMPIHKPIKNNFHISATPRWSQPKPKPSVPAPDARKKTNDGKCATS